MKKIRFLVVLLILAAVIYYLISMIPGRNAEDGDLTVLVVYSPGDQKDSGYIKDAYKSVLQEEGVPFQFVKASYLLASAPEKITSRHPAVILPDGIARMLPLELKHWLKEYVNNGGNALVVYDAGTRSLKGTYQDRALFSQMLELNYILYTQLEAPEESYTTGYFRFKDSESTGFFQYPPGKTNDQHYIVGYSYGELTYPFAATRRGPNLKDNNIHAYGVTADGTAYPAIVLKSLMAGKLLYVNLPLGHLKAHSDDLPMRSILRTFLFKIARTPHLVNTPGGQGGLVINWHIDEQRDWAGIQFMVDNGFLTENLRYSFHNTAGDANDEPGDGRGFDACGRGRKYLEPALKYGVLGSHGGWFHNWFARNLQNGNLKKKEIASYVRKNNKCLESLSGVPIVEYSAPDGVHPQPLMTEVLEDEGIETYYYTGDSGSFPNRTFHEKEMVSSKLLAFPVLSYRKVASFHEMKRDGVPDREVEKWLDSVLSYVIDNRTVRLIYSHSYDLPPYYPEILKAFILRADQLAGEGKLNVQPMTFFTGYLQRLLATRFRFTPKENSLEIRLSNPGGLEGMILSVPAAVFEKYPKPETEGIAIRRDRDDYYLEIKEKVVEKTIHFGADPG